MNLLTKFKDRAPVHRLGTGRGSLDQGLFCQGGCMRAGRNFLGPGP